MQWWYPFMTNPISIYISILFLIYELIIIVLFIYIVTLLNVVSWLKHNFLLAKIASIVLLITKINLMLITLLGFLQRYR